MFEVNSMIIEVFMVPFCQLLMYLPISCTRKWKFFSSFLWAFIYCNFISQLC